MSKTIKFHSVLQEDGTYKTINGEETPASEYERIIDNLGDLSPEEQDILITLNDLFLEYPNVIMDAVRPHLLAETKRLKKVINEFKLKNKGD